MKWWLSSMMSGCLLAAPVWAVAAEQEGTQASRMQALYESAYGSEEGGRRYRQWIDRRDLPLKDYIATAGDTPPASTTVAPAHSTHTSTTTTYTSQATMSSVAGESVARGTTSQPLPASGGYLLTEGDLLKVSVWQWEDLSEEVIVRPDGKISFPLIGDVQAIGLGVAQLDESITERLRLYIKEPQVSVAIQKFGGKKVIILGSVDDPGVYYPNRKSTVLEAVALAGGFIEGAQRKHVVVIRGDAAHPETHVLNLNPLLKGKAELQDNVSVEPEDIIFVPSSRMYRLGKKINSAADLAYKAALTYLAGEQILATEEQ